MLIDQFYQRLILVTDLEIPLSTTKLLQEILQRSWEDWSRTCSFPSVPNRAGSCRNTCILTPSPTMLGKKYGFKTRMHSSNAEMSHEATGVTTMEHPSRWFSQIIRRVVQGSCFFRDVIVFFRYARQVVPRAMVWHEREPAIRIADRVC